PIQIDALVILNDAIPGVVELCKSNVAPILAEIKDNATNLAVDCQFLSNDFEAAYPSIKQTIQTRGHNSNVLFNLDQCGHSKVQLRTISDILSSYPAPEVILTFAIQALLTFLPKTDKDELSKRLRQFGVQIKTLDDVEECLTNKAWLGAAERTVFDAFRGFGSFTSPFSINNPSGYRYWLLHFAKNFRARQVYNDILHQNSSSQAHFGRPGLNMLSYDPDQEGLLYLFEDDDRKRAIDQLHDDIPRALANFGDAIEMSDFYHGVYNHTPSHSDDIHQAIIDSPELSVVTPNGGPRRVANTIRPGDVLKLTPQRNFFSVLFPK
ncbi:MAG TPA: three-Cys-motif partner protein TcmP, partial [Planctomycetes bacterium]|nr:three-Cys-motif partner protein TcmP [Planctomycetota bacterium]